MALDDRTLEAIPSWICVALNKITPDELLRKSVENNMATYLHPQLGEIVVDPEKIVIGERTILGYGHNDSNFAAFRAGFFGGKLDYGKAPKFDTKFRYARLMSYDAGEKARRGTVWKWRKLKTI